jgi:ElaA protein
MLHAASFKDLDTRTLYAILRLRCEVFVVEQECPYQDVDGRDEGARHLWLSTQAGIVAYLRILDEPDGAARIGRVCVARDLRGAGHAGALLAAALEEIGGREAVLDAQTYATRLYANAGFVADGPEFLDDGIPHVPMRRPAPGRAS